MTDLANKFLLQGHGQQDMMTYLMEPTALLQVQDLCHTVDGPVVVVPEALLQPSGLGPASIPLATPVSSHNWHHLQGEPI